MRRFLIALLVLMLPGAALAASSCTVTTANVSSGVTEISWAWTAHTDGSFTATAGSTLDGFVVLAIADPGATSPTANYDVLLVNSDGADILGDTAGATSPAYDGSGANRSATVTQTCLPKVGSTYSSVFVRGPLTLHVKNNVVSGATGTVKIYVVK